ncbi:uncharacterized protein LOC115622459 [Scaptodrosophila lebanonensis]|uniref:Uncharacterized protein LOC115622450 n=1 Tax=Drosophila lebanonensis TaxID=7225 RepID=A0A6J2TBC3_DROLE|nr:uncharacterized protein LOC115622450 [Scaptodrosophila lebanonensis]XP_030372264.1 uncharacterized protein LOC115622459 [Scaptodrosophila lebanonensis]
MDRSWITSFAWSIHEKSDTQQLLLGTASGGLFTLHLSSDAQVVLQHQQFQSTLGRICYIRAFKKLVVVGDNNGLVHLYNLSNNEGGLFLLKALWLRPDRVGTQYVELTYCFKYDCYFIAICKGAHLLVWCMPNSKNDPWLEAQLYVGGTKITGLSALSSNVFALTTARQELKRVELTLSMSNKQTQLSLSMEPIEIEDCENYQLLGVFCSRHKNLLSVLQFRNEESEVTTALARHATTIRLGKLHKSSALDQLSVVLEPNKGADWLIPKGTEEVTQETRKLEDTCNAMDNEQEPVAAALAVLKPKRSHCIDDKGTTRLNNEVWTPDVCTKCNCYHGQVNCLREKCSEISCPPGVEPLTPPEACCPHCPQTPLITLSGTL